MEELLSSLKDISLTEVCLLQDALAFNLYYNGEFGGGYSNNTYGGQVPYAF